VQMLAVWTGVVELTALGLWLGVQHLWK